MRTDVPSAETVHDVLTDITESIKSIVAKGGALKGHSLVVGAEDARVLSHVLTYLREDWESFDEFSKSEALRQLAKG